MKNFKDDKKQFLKAIENNGNRSEVKRLLSHPKVNINANNRNGETPLHKVSKEGNMDAMKIMVFRGGDVNASDKV